MIFVPTCKFWGLLKYCGCVWLYLTGYPALYVEKFAVTDIQKLNNENKVGVSEGLAYRVE